MGVITFSKVILLTNAARAAVQLLDSFRREMTTTCNVEEDDKFAFLKGTVLPVDRLQLEQPPRDAEDLGIMVRREDGGYNVDVDGPRGAVLRLRGLRLGAGDRIDLSSGFQEPAGGWPEMVTGAARATGGAGSGRSSDTIPKDDGARARGPTESVDVAGGPG